MFQCRMSSKVIEKWYYYEVFSQLIWECYSVVKNNKVSGPVSPPSLTQDRLSYSNVKLSQVNIEANSFIDEVGKIRSYTICLKRTRRIEVNPSLSVKEAIDRVKS